MPRYGMLQKLSQALCPGVNAMSQCGVHGDMETWIRQRIETAQSTRSFHRTLKEQDLTMLEIREEFRKTYAEYPELYELARERERLHPGFLRYRGNTSDFRQRYTLRVMLYETEKLVYEKFCRWSGLPRPNPDVPFCEQPNSMRVVRDLSTVEELELMLALSRYMLSLFDSSQHPMSPSQLMVLKTMMPITPKNIPNC